MSTACFVLIEMPPKEAPAIASRFDTSPSMLQVEVRELELGEAVAIFQRGALNCQLGEEENGCWLKHHFRPPKTVGQTEGSFGFNRAVGHVLSVCFTVCSYLEHGHQQRGSSSQTLRGAPRNLCSAFQTPQIKEATVL